MSHVLNALMFSSFVTGLSNYTEEIDQHATQKVEKRTSGEWDRDTTNRENHIRNSHDNTCRGYDSDDDIRGSSE